MPIKSYGVSKGKAIDGKAGTGNTPHYQIHVVDNHEHFRIAVNIKSQSDPSTVLCHIDEHFDHPILAKLPSLPDQFSPLKSDSGGIALDFIRSNLFDLSELKPLASHVTGPNNDLNDRIDGFVQRAISTGDAVVYAFGSRWGPEKNPDPYFGFQPGNGVHDIHMNQGNSSQWQNDDGVWQDGALFFHFPSANQWVAVFIAFQSQSFYTDDKTGHALNIQPKHQNAIKISAALVNTQSHQQKSVTLINRSPGTIDLTGWSIVNGDRKKHELKQSITSGQCLTVFPAAGTADFLPEKGGIISVLDPQNLKVDGVSYTESDTQNPGWTITF